MVSRKGMVYDSISLTSLAGSSLIVFTINHRGCQIQTVRVQNPPSRTVKSELRVW